MKPPSCKLCGKAHWTYDPHDTSALEEVRGLGASVLRNQTPTVTKPRDENVTEPVDSVTELVTGSTVHVSPEKMEEEFKAGRMSYTHGGARDGSGRKRQHNTNAERQRAYRSRK